MRHAAWPVGLALAVALAAGAACTGYSHPTVDEPEVEDDLAQEPAQDPERWDEVIATWTEPVEPTEEARARFRAATEAFARGDYDRALSEFEAAHALEPAGALRFNIAVCLQRLGRIEEAAAELDALAGDASQPENVRAQAAGKRDALRGAGSQVASPDADMALAERIVTRIIDLRRRHPRLRELSADDVTRHEDGRGLDLKFERGVHYRDNPDCRPGQKCSRLEDFDHDGVEIYVYLSLDPWQGAAAVLPRRIGGLHVVSFIDGPDNAGMDRVRAEIDAILADAGG